MLVATACVLSGCGGAMNSFDPTDMLNFLDQKKPLPGARKPVFPEGVPGVEQGVPKELYKGAPQDDLAATAPVAPGGAPAGAAQHNGAPVAAEASPEPKPKKRVHTAKRRSITAPPPDEAPAAAPPPQQQQQPAAAPAQEQPLSSFPAPLPSGSFSH
ncbi:hypothetical protein [Afipia felis]|uniref:Uncharacterized protein n=2 Tax=Afipia felis TaxID=1035 RepID=A0A380W8V2_AFIFE|nr:hypothetical protein [Afipia felis]EKS28541.1 hypothetical protein HMPREF9697_01069 [Afipia felis ATCC 53690]SUU77249.1 Uncharacterised protein [Afipia felis]SUU85316.1 Uncharacterised protein [Afipia felis]